MQPQVMFIIDKLAYTNRLRGTHPAEKMTFALLTLLSVLLTDSVWVLTAVLGIMVLFTLLKIGTPVHIYWKLLLIPAMFIVMGVIPIMVEVGTSDAPAWMSVRYHEYGLRMTPDSVAQAGTLFLKSFASIACFYVLVLSTPVNDVLYLLGRLGVSGSLVEMMALVYRYIGTFMETVQNMYNSQRNRLGYDSFRKSMRSSGMLMSSVVVRSFVRSETAYNALLSRCYRGEITTLKEMCPVNMYSLILIVCCESALLGLVIGFRLW